MLDEETLVAPSEDSLIKRRSSNQSQRKKYRVLSQKRRKTCPDVFSSGNNINEDEKVNMSFINY